MHFKEIISDLKGRRILLGVTQENLAGISGVGLRTVKEIERGKGNPTLQTLCKLADVLGMEIRLEVKKPTDLNK